MYPVLPSLSLGYDKEETRKIWIAKYNLILLVPL